MDEDEAEEDEVVCMLNCVGRGGRCVVRSVLVNEYSVVKICHTEH